MKIYIETPRLILREWKEEDLPGFVRMNADPRVMEFFLNSLDEQESYALYQLICKEFAERGFGGYAVERKEGHAFIGFTGLHQTTFDVDFAPAVEVAWRLLPEYWGNGYAPEAASACLEYARTKLGLKEVVAFTSLLNKRSQRVMQKIGMQKVKEFRHPLVPAGHPLCEHVLYHKLF